MRTVDEVSNQHLRIRPATTRDRPTILDIFATGMADNPLHVAAYLGPVVGGRVTRWLGTWADHDPGAVHGHIGPVAVRKESQGRGLGTALLEAVVERLDHAGLAGYLETDRAQNVPFYERQGFAVVAEGDVLGVPNWFMWRDAPKHRSTEAPMIETARRNPGEHVATPGRGTGPAGRAARRRGRQSDRRPHRDGRDRDSAAFLARADRAR